MKLWFGLHKTDEHLSEIINRRLKRFTQENKQNANYFLINFSCVPDFGNVSSRLLIDIHDTIKYTEFARNKNIDLLKVLPYFWLSYDSDIIYLVNNVKVIKKNKIWFEMRRNHNDIMIDLSGKCLKCRR